MKTKLAKKNRVGGFTLLEMLGVLAVMSILASVAVPPMLRSMQNAQSVNEDKNLEEIGRALCEAIQAEGQVPNPGALATDTTDGSKGWVAMAAPYCSMSSESIQYVFPGRTETERRYYILTLSGLSLAPSLSVYPGVGNYRVPATGWNTNVIWPGIQTSFLVLISSSKPDYLLACPVNSGDATYTTWAGLDGPEAVYWAAKTWVKKAVDGVYSATNTQIVDESWTNKGQFLHVKAIPMTEVLSDVTVSSIPPGQSIGYSTNSPTSYPITTNSTNVWFPRGTSIQVVRQIAPTFTNLFRPIQSKTAVQLDNTTNWVNKN
ncbi:MAG: type II secretion system protein [Verrucomicrobia bacterium]|nr:type II secretion system protein [Verrucomicrobiota bacterium]